MNELKYYPCGYSGDDFLSVKESIISHSEYLENGYIQLIECDKESNTMKVMEKKENDREWTEINMDGLQRGVTIDFENSNLPSLKTPLASHFDSSANKTSASVNSSNALTCG